MDPPRTYERVAALYGVTEGAIRRIARRDGWADEAAEVDRKAMVKASALGLRTREQRVVKVLTIVDKVLDDAEVAIDRGTFEVRPSDIPHFVRLAELLEGEATDRIEGSAVVGLVVQLGAIASSDRPLEERRAEFRRVLESVQRGELEPGRPELGITEESA